MRWCLLLVLVLVLGCGSSPVVVDGSSDAKYTETLRAMTSDLSDEEAKQFASDMLLVGIAGSSDEPIDIAIMGKISKLPGGLDAYLRKNLNGRSLSQIRQRASELRTKQPAVVHVIDSLAH